MNSLKKVVLLLTCWLALSVAASASPITYSVSVNTSSIAGTTGFLDFQLLPEGGGNSDAATASITGFSTDGSGYSTLPPDIGDVTGSLPGAITMDNGSGGADHAENFTYGTYLTFFVALDVPTVSNTATDASTFTFDVKDGDYDSALSDVPLLQIELNVDGSQTPTNGNSADLTIAPASASVPEPGTLLLLGSGIMAVRRFRKGVHGR